MSTASHPNDLNVELCQQLLQIKHQFADAILRSFIVIVMIGVPLSLSRAFSTGWLPIYSLHLGLGTMVLLMALISRRLPLTFKSLFLIFTFWMIGFPGVLTFGFASPGIWWLVVSCLIAYVLFSRRSALMIVGLTLGSLILTAVAFVFGVIQVQVDANALLSDPAAWSTYIIVNSIIFFVVFHALQAFTQANQMTANHQFRQWIDELPLGILVRGKDEKVYYQNKVATEFLGKAYPQTSALFKSGSNSPYPPDQLPAIRALRGEICKIDDLELHHQGEVRFLQAWGRPGYNANGDLAFGIAAFEDITERKQLELMKNQFISTVSHELRTPLTSIHGALSLMVGGVVGTPSPQMQQMLQIADDNAKRLLHLINDLLDMQKLDSGQMSFHWERTDLVALLGTAIMQMQNYKGAEGVSFELHCESPALWIQTDAHRFMQLLMNLMSNAAKFSPPHSKVELHLQKLPDEKVRLEVHDEGSGIPLDFQPKVFQPFSQSDSGDTRQLGGTGLGLSISKAIVERHGGRIWFESQPGQGTQFYVEVPVVPDTSTH